DSVMFAGRVEPCCRICWAWLSVALAFELVLADELEVELFFDEPQAESAPAATTAVTAATTALRRDQRTTGVRVGMVAVSSLWGVVMREYSGVGVGHGAGAPSWNRRGVWEGGVGCRVRGGKRS